MDSLAFMSTRIHTARFCVSPITAVWKEAHFGDDNKILKFKEPQVHLNWAQLSEMIQANNI